MTPVLLWSALGAVAVLLLAAGRWPWRTAAVSGAALGCAAGIAVHGTGLSRIADSTAGLVSAGAVLAVITAVAARWLPRRLRSRRDRWPVLGLAAIVATFFGVIAMMLWRTADDGLQLASVPEIRTRDDLVTWRDAAPGERLYGVLVQAAVAAPGGGDAAGETGEVASVRSVPIGPVDLPAAATGPPPVMVLEFDGHPLGSEGVTSIRQTWHWPEGPAGRPALSVGDPVVVWADIDAAGVPGTVPGSGLTDVRLIAHGDIETFRGAAAPLVARTAAVALGFAVFDGLLALLVALGAVLLFRRLARSGTDDPPLFHVG